MTAAADVLRRLDDNASAHQWPGAEPLLRDAAALIREQRLRIRELESWRATVLDRAERAEAERDAAIKDAERYRWLRDHPVTFANGYALWNGAVLDATIDAARARAGEK